MKADFEFKDKYNFNDLVEIIKILRAPGGCPWDAEQTHTSIRENFLEETYEALEAIDTGNKELLKEELGDVLLQVVFHAQIESEKHDFNIRDVTTGISDGVNIEIKKGVTVKDKIRGPQKVADDK